ncbi:MAG: carboxylate-amine ligase [Xanthobacteraceae bacterium]|nr:carboxylate-amine ligase [Xanthobacteraceae bacterium]
MAGNFTFGIEEEYFLVDAQTKSVARDMPQAFLEAARKATGGRIAGEFLQSQIEVVSSPHTSMAEARRELHGLRQTLAAVAADHGLAFLAAGTHPTAIWGDSVQTQKDRYDAVMHDLQMIGQRNMLCGMHVHIELPDPDARVDLMYRMLPYLPLFLALSTSSPFWQSRRTGLKGYRLAAYDELPRTGVPELFRTKEEFDAYVAALVKAGVMEDSSYVWWAIRPSLNHPTLELRAPDCCTLLDDTLAIAALYRVLSRHLYNNPWRNADMNAVSRAIVVENKWRAQRYGVDGTFVAEEGAVTVAEMLDRLIEETQPDIDALECATEIRRCQAIAAAGTSADAQLAVYEAHCKDESRDCALRAVTDWIAGATLQ